MSKKTKNHTGAETKMVATEAKALDQYGRLRKIEPDEDCLDMLEGELLNACADWIDDHQLAYCIYNDLGQGHEDEDRFGTLYGYLRDAISDVRARLETSIDTGGFYVVGGAQ